MKLGEIFFRIITGGMKMWYVCKYFDTHFEECMGKYENKDDAERTAKWFNDGNKSGLVSYEVRFEDKK